ncbi:dockerin type I domain-containing protein [Halobellus sp. EA9]|uniref:dockerin type I domain-containing protein n=1 Tax=Halobellus sp. EA9 TaxID=3421647 RepID=UPI003EBB7DCF
MRRLLAALLAVALVTSMGSVPVGAAPAFGVEVDTPAAFSVGENRITVTVNNTASSDDLFSPLVEVPLTPGLSAPSDPNPVVVSSGESRTYAVQNSSYTDGDSLFVYGESVPAGETRTYAFTLTVERAGDHTIEADVRPLYNEANNVRASTTATALDVGTLNVAVLDENDSPLAGATVSINDTSRSGGEISETLVEGSYDVSATVGGSATPTETVTISPNGVTNVTFVRPSGDVTVVSSTGERATVENGSTLQRTTVAGNATTATRFEVSAVVDVPDGSAVVSVADPDGIPSGYTAVSATVDGSDITVTRDDNRTRVSIDSAGLRTVTVEYVGYGVGDVTREGTVDADDTARIAAAVADGQGVAALPYGDVDGDGSLTAIDAMYVAQYTAGNRTADYGRP